MKKSETKKNNTLADYLKSQEVEDWIYRPAARTAKTTAKGFASLGDLANLPVNIARGFMGQQPLQSPSEMVGEAFDEYTDGLTQPQNAFERGIDTAGEFITAGGPFGMAGKAAPILSKLAARTSQELAGTAAAGGGFQVGREIEPDNPYVALATSLVPGAATSLAKAAISPRNTLASGLGINPEKAQAFKEAGLNPTLGDITDSRFIKGGQNILAEAPLAGGIIGNAIQQTTNKIARFGQGLSPLESGDLAQKSLATSYITKANKLIPKLKESWEKNITNSDNMQLNKASEIFSKKLPFSEPENLKAHEGSTIGKFTQELKDITQRNNGEISFGDAKHILDRIDNKITTFGSIGTKEQGELKQLRGALSEDMRSLAYSKGEKVGKDFDRYNKFYTQYRKKLDAQIQPLLKNKTAVETFNSIKNDLRIDAKKADVVLKTLKPAEKEIFSQSLVRELGMNPQNEFKAANLATNFKKLEPQAQEIVLSGLPKEVRDEFRASIEAIDHMKGTKAQANPSGTFNQLFKFGIVGAFIKEPVIASAAAIGGLGAAKLMSSPAFLKWLSKVDNIKNEAQGAKHIDELSKVAKGNPEIAPAIEQYLQNLSQEPEMAGNESPSGITTIQDIKKLSDRELLDQYLTPERIKKLSNEELTHYYNLRKAMHSAQP